MDHDLSYTQNRELSWLKFNERILAEAADPSVPLMERLRFVSIFTSNLDEFFMVRVGSLFDLMMMAPDDAENKSGMTPAEQLDSVFHAVRPMIAQRDRTYYNLTQEMKAAGVEDVAYENLAEEQKGYIRDYYKNYIRPVLSPQIIDRSHPFPHLKNKALYVAALLINARDKKNPLLAIVDVPSAVPPIIPLKGEKNRFVRTESVIEAHLKKLYKAYELQEHAVISVTRNADISMDEEKFDEDNPDLLAMMSRVLKKRERLAPVRLELQGKAPALTKVLMQCLKLEPRQVYQCDCPLKLGYAYMLDRCPEEMYYPPHQPSYPGYLDREQPILDQVRQRDVLLFYPYQSMQPFIDLLKQSAADPNVVSIKITIYRLARNSAIAKALCEAAEKGKEVTVLMELRARFDEQNNIEWARELEEAGCRILYGPEGFKCHAKICLITRKERNGFSYVTQVGTGNYNEKTSTLYTDFCMMTTRPEVAQDAITFFQNMLMTDLNGEYESLLVAPNSMKNRLLNMIDGEIAKGSRGRIIIKANSVTERELIDKLSEASCAGVRIDLIIRGICCLLPGIPGKTENIRVCSIVGRFLEHSRIYAFGEGEEMRLYLSSADMMTRNQTRRVEVACPVTSSELKDFLHDYLMKLLEDNRKAWRLQPDGNYIQNHPENNENDHPVQIYYLKNDIELTPSAKPGRNLRTRFRRLFGR